MKKIVFITTFPSFLNQHDKSGVGSYNMYLAKSLEQLGLEVEVYAQKEEGFQNEKEGNILVTRVWSKSIFGMFKLFFQIIKDRPKVVHIQHEVNLFGNELVLPFTPFIAFFVRIFGGKVITTFHGGMGLKEIDKNFIKENGKRLPPFFIKFAFRYIFGLFSLFSNKIIVHEDFQKTQLIEEHGVKAEKIFVIPHGVPENPEIRENAREFFDLPKDKVVYLFMGFAAKYKGLPELYREYKNFLEKNKDSILLLGMSPTPRLQNDKEYMSWFDSLKNNFISLGDNVKIYGFMDSTAISYAYSASDYVIFPYSRRLAASGPMAIAIGYKKPIIMSNIMKGEKGEYSFDFGDIIHTEKFYNDRTWLSVGEKTLNIYEIK